jgi:hypothetical protein
MTLRYCDLQRVRDAWRNWTATPAPCGISYADPYNPCLPEDDDGLICLTCGLRQRLAITAGTTEQET